MDIMKFIKKTRFFTLIELIVVIVVLGILAAIVTPNISSFQEEAEHTSISSNVRNLQTSVDMFVLENNGQTPTKNIPTLGNPQTLEIYGLHPEYTRDLPKNKGIHWWLDYNNTVWASYVDAPTEVKYSDDTSKLTWKTVEGAELYKIYKSEDALTSSVKNPKGIRYIQELESKEGIVSEVSLPKLSEGFYLISAVDKFEFETAPTKAGTIYEGYGEGPSKDFFVSNSSIPSNQKPTAVISFTPNNNLTTATDIVWGYEPSTDPENDSLTKAEWKVNGTVLESPPTNLPAGEHTIELRVQDSKGLWSEWVQTKLNITEAITWDYNGIKELADWGYNSNTGYKQHTYDSISNTVTLNSGSYYTIGKGFNNPITDKSKATLEVELSAGVNANFSYNLGESVVYLTTDYKSSLGFKLGDRNVSIVNGDVVHIVNQYPGSRAKYKVTVNDGTVNWYINGNLVHTATMSKSTSWSASSNGIVLGDNANNSNYSTATTYYNVKYSETRVIE